MWGSYGNSWNYPSNVSLAPSREPGLTGRELDSFSVVLILEGAAAP